MDEKTTEEEEILPAIGVLAELDEAIRRRLTAAGKFTTLPEGNYLALQGHEPESVWFILSGKVSVKCHAHGDTVDLATLGAGESVGEMSAIDPQRASANVRTSEETRVWQISTRDFNAFLESDAAAGYAIVRALAKELCRRVRRDSERSLRDADQRHTQSFDADY